MKRPRNIDFVCSDCGHEETRLVETNDDGSVIGDQPCGAPRDEPPSCHGIMAAREYGIGGYAQTINRNNADFAERQRERLEKRSWEHWQKKGKDEAVDRTRALEKKYER